MRRGLPTMRGRPLGTVTATFALAAGSALSGCSAFLDDFDYVEAGVDVGSDASSGTTKDTTGEGGSGIGAVKVATDAGDSSTMMTMTLDGATSMHDAAPDASDGAVAETGAPPPPVTYAATVIADGAVAYWRFGEPPSSTTARSEVDPAAYDAPFLSGTLGAPGAIVGDSNTAITLDGSQGAIVLSDVFSFIETSAFTIELWIKPANSPSSNYEFLSKESGTANRSDFFYEGTPGASYHADLELGSTDVYLNPTANPNIGAWNYAVVVSDGTMFSVYLNNVLLQSQTIGGSGSYGGSNTFSVGCDENGYSGFAGDVDEVAVYDKALAQKTIANHYARARGM